MSKISRSLIRRFNSTQANVSITNADIRAKRNSIFQAEKERQRSLNTRVAKIMVEYIGQPNRANLFMNINMSTPHDCAKHLGDMLMNRSVVALADEKPWDMHRPLVKPCKLDLLHFRQDDPSIANKAFWRSCSFILGAVAETVFKDEFNVELHSWPAVNVRSGSFVYDVDLKMKDWVPRKEELRALTLAMRKMISKNLPFERLDIDSTVALKMFEDNRYKCEQIPKICNKSEFKSLSVYRLGDHIDISQGPMIANTSFIGNSAIASIHPLSNSSAGQLHRFQGLAIPNATPVSHFIFDFLTTRATKLNVFKSRFTEQKSADKSPFVNSITRNNLQ